MYTNDELKSVSDKELIDTVNVLENMDEVLEKIENMIKEGEVDE